MSPKAGQAVYLKTSKQSEKISFAWVNRVVPVVVICLSILLVRNLMNDPDVLPVNKIRVHGTFVNVDEAMLHRAIDGVVAGGYFNVDVEKVKSVVESLPWVSHASVRRVWPDTLSVQVIEQKPVAISAENGLINIKGESFHPKKKVNIEGLPVFKGKVELNAMMIETYHLINTSLTGIEQKIVYLEVDDRHAINFTMENGLTVVLGKDETDTRLNRFISIYKKLIANRLSDIAAIDLRYTNGLAIRWKNNMNIHKKV